MLGLELLTNPLWREEDAGKAIPNSPHATSVAMPLWRHVIAYEERDEAFMKQMQAGYPRFVIHPQVQILFDHVLARRGRAGETCFVYPSERLARQAVQFLHAEGVDAARWELGIEPSLFGVFLPEEAIASAKKFWQHYGGIVSSRQAAAALEGALSPVDDGTAQLVRARIAALVGAHAGHVYLYPTGMAALAGALAICQARRPGAKSIQLGFPYVDGLKIQNVRRPGVHFFPNADEQELQQVADLVRSEPISAVFCELPGNPLLRSIHVPQLAQVLREARVPLVVDDTVATFANVDLLPHVDLLVSSLTKNFSGVGDVMAGSMILNPHAWSFDELASFQERIYENVLWPEDATVLEKNSRDFEQRMVEVNETALLLVEWLRGQSSVSRVHYPTEENPAAYNAVKRSLGGYGGLFSVVLRNGSQSAPRVFDALRVSKGPSLGTNYSLACPYALLAHYEEQAWIESLGIAPHLIRFSVGLEGFDELRNRWGEALSAAE